SNRQPQYRHPQARSSQHSLLGHPKTTLRPREMRAHAWTYSRRYRTLNNLGSSQCTRCRPRTPKHLRSSP
ncbi:MAG: hypothetical protein L6R42_010610, partial [Xanthoria sp. 1 TBL-2021]